MAKVLEHHGTLYDEDLLAWAEQQAAHLRAVRLAVIATGLRRSSFPNALPYDRRAILGDGDDPDEPVSA